MERALGTTRRALLPFSPITDDEIERLWKNIDQPLSAISVGAVWYEIGSLRESIRRLLTEREAE